MFFPSRGLLAVLPFPELCPGSGETKVIAKLCTAGSAGHVQSEHPPYFLHLLSLMPLVA